ncbi:MAG: trypsin-like peptidase domain-containing protein [Verrucomicrobiae bacterium]|nr:trypsin-like peptidase domain-containing protein [Verrucomicrobiae bacterium]
MKNRYRTILRTRFGLPVILLIAIASAGQLYGDVRPVDEIAREVAEARGDAIVTLAVVMKMTLSVTGAPEQSQEQTAEVPGAIVNRQGWVATSYSNLQPHVTPGGLPDGIEANITTEIQELKIIWANGDESTAEVVLHDSDLDVSIIRPIEARESAVSIDFLTATGGAPPKVLDEIIMLGRQGKSIDRLILVETGRLNALIERPRPMFVASIAAPGTPVFDRGGELLGMSALKRSGDENPAPVIRPAADVAKVLRAALDGAGVATVEPVNAGASGGLAETGRVILDKFQDSIVSLLAVTESRGRTQEVRSVGVVIGGDGLVVTSRSAAGSDLKEVKIILADGSEVAATVVLDDPDLDLAYVRAKQEDVEAQGLTFTPVQPDGEEHKPAALQLADPVIILTREAPAFFRQAKLIVTHVDSVVDLPRRYYRTPQKQGGAAAFNMAGELVGVYARRVSGEETRHRMILPMAHVYEGAERARKAISDTDSTPASAESTDIEQGEPEQ